MSEKSRQNQAKSVNSMTNNKKHHPFLCKVKNIKFLFKMVAFYKRAWYIIKAFL